LASPYATEAHAREIAREEIASLCGLVLRRLGDSGDDYMSRIFGEAPSVSSSS